MNSDFIPDKTLYFWSSWIIFIGHFFLQCGVEVNTLITGKGESVDEAQWGGGGDWAWALNCLMYNNESFCFEGGIKCE